MADIDAAFETAPLSKSGIGEPSGRWDAVVGGGVEGLTRRLSAVQLDAMESAVRQTMDRDTTEITASDFSAPEIVDLMNAARYDIHAGRGAVVLSGVDLDRFDLESFKRLHWGLGTHLGAATFQSARQDLIGFVRKEPSPEKRGYLSDAELGPHTDFHEILSLASVVTSEEGGVSGFVSAAAIYDAMREEHPDLLEHLEEGYYYPTSLETVSDYKVPTFSVIDGHIGLYNYALYIIHAAEIRGEEVPPKLAEALRAMFKVAARPQLMMRFTLQPGEIVFWHNFRVLHSRTAFKNTPERERLLLRLWLNAHDHYPLHPGYRETSAHLDRQHGEGWSMLVNTDERMKAAHDLIHRK